MKLIKKNTIKLTNKEIKDISILKNSHWNFGLKSQNLWFKNKKNVKKDDIHLFIKKKNSIIGYVQLGKRKFNLDRNSKKYLLFRTIIIHKKFRKKHLSNKIMDKVSKICRAQKIISFLICKKKLINFYKKNNWKKLKNSQFKIPDHQSNLVGMIYDPLQKKINRKIIFYYST